MPIYAHITIRSSIVPVLPLYVSVVVLLLLLDVLPDEAVAFGELAGELHHLLVGLPQQLAQALVAVLHHLHLRLQDADLIAAFVQGGLQPLQPLPRLDPVLFHLAGQGGVAVGEFGQLPLDFLACCLVLLQFDLELGEFGAEVGVLAAEGGCLALHLPIINPIDQEMKNIIESVLVKHLGKYIDGLKNSLDIGLLDGEVSIENVSLKPSFVNELGLPFTLKFSHIEKIHISIPWTSLKEKSTMVSVRGIYVLLNISYEEGEAEVEPGELLRSMVERIRLEMKKKWSEEGGKEEGFAEKNLIRIVDNAVVSINNIHVRLESYCRNWDYSFGLIMDDITSYTVDENEERTFYTRHFSHKEKNQPFKKILNIDKLQLYFNDQEQLFICNHLHRSTHALIRTMSHPFPKRDTSTPSPNKKKPTDDNEPYPQYTLKNLTTIRLSAVGSQRFAADMRYIVEVSVVIHSIDMRVGSKQLSQVFHCVQHFYDYGLNIVKNGRKGYNFDDNTQKFYRAAIAKIARDEKLVAPEQAQLLQILREVPLSILENITDEVVSKVRFDKEMKKITEIKNAEKGRKMMQELLDKKEKLEAMEGIDIFKEVLIEAKVYRVNLGICDLKDTPIADLSLVGIFLQVNMNLTGEISIGCEVKNIILYAGRKEVTADHFDPNLSMISLTTVLSKKKLALLQVKVLKKEVRVTEEMVCSIMDWVSLIKLKPSLLNYVAQQLDYSIDITRVMIKFFCAREQQINLEIALPILHLQVGANNFFLNLGRMQGVSELGSHIFRVGLVDELEVSCDSVNLLTVEPNLAIEVIDKTDKTTYEQIEFSLPGIKVANPQYAIKQLFGVMHSDFLSKAKSVEIVDNSTDEVLEGEFYLNKIKSRLKARISQSQLVFFRPEMVGFPEQRISLTRTRIYRLTSGNRFFIVFKEEVDKEVNIVQADNDKAMKTLFIKLKDYIQEISTAFQWEKYYRQIYREDIATLQEIQDVNTSNDILMTLQVKLALIQVELAPDAQLKLRAMQANIKYNEFNTEASLGLGALDLNVNREKVISDASFKGSYEWLQSKVIQVQVSRLNYQVQLFSTFSKMISISSQYQLFLMALTSQGKKAPLAVVEEDEERLAHIKSQQSRADNINKFLLQLKMDIIVGNIDGEILKYRNRLESLTMQLEKNRNELIPSLSADFKGMLLFSMIELPLVSIAFTPTQLTVEVHSLNAQIDLQTMIYEVVKGEGSLIVKEVIKSIRDKKIAKEEYRAQHREGGPRKRVVSGRVGSVRVQVKIAGGLSLGVSLKDMQLVNGRFCWSETLFWFNSECISLVENNGIVKWGGKAVSVCMTNFKLKLNSKEILFLANELKKISKFFKTNKFNAISFIEQEFSNPDDKGRVAAQPEITFNIRIQQVEMVYECGDKNPLLSVRLRPLFLTNEGEVNSINLSVWHLNRALKLYEPILQPLEVKVVSRAESGQFQLYLQELYLIVTQECVVDCLSEVKLLQRIQKEMEKDESSELQEMGGEEIERAKAEMLEKAFGYYDSPNFHQNIEYNFMLRMANRLGSPAIVEICCGKKEKQRLMFEGGDLGLNQTKAIYISQRTSYHHSYELIQRYEKVQLKVCLMNEYYSSRSITTSFLLYDQDNHYIQPLTIVDSQGVEIQSNVAVKVTYSEGVYLIDLIGKYRIVSEVDLPLHFRYSDACSINKFTLKLNDQLLLPPWVVDYVTFGLREDEYDNVLLLRPKGEEDESGGWFLLHVPTHDKKGRVELALHKEAVHQLVKETPKFHYLREKTSDEKVIDEFNKTRKKGNIDKDKEELPQDKSIPHSLYNFRIIPGVLLFNHLAFPITVNSKVFDPNQQKELHQIYLEEQKQFVSVCLGDRSTHQIYLPALNEALPLNLKLSDQNFVTLLLQVRRNRLQQRVVHVYCEVHLVVNLPHLHTPTLITNIYQYKFIMRKEVKNGHGDRPHPSPVLKDKFCFNTSHYLLSLEEKYLLMKVNNCTSNEFILFHSDFDKDLSLTSDLSGQIEAVFAVSYQCKQVLLQTNEEGRKPQVLECFTTYIMPKYYLINRSEESFVVNGSLLLRPGEKVTIDNIKFLDLNVRDQLEFKYNAQNIDKATFIIFLRGTEQEQEEQRGEQLHNKAHEEDNFSNQADKDVREKLTQINAKFQNMQMLKTVTEVSEPSARLPENEPQQYEGQSDIQSTARHTVKMEDIQIFANSKRMCEYNTISYEINGWSEWLNVNNTLRHPVSLKIQLGEGIVAVERIEPSGNGRIIGGISQIVEVVLHVDDSDIILGKFELEKRLNHTIFLKDCQYEEIRLKETKIKIGRLMTIDCPKEGEEHNIHKVVNSLRLSIGKIRISLVLYEERVRKELIRFSLLQTSLLFMRYKNGLYMCNLQFASLAGIHKRVSFLVLKSFTGYVEGVEGQFVERLALSVQDVLEITLSDELIVSVIEQVQALSRYFPPLVKQASEQVSKQEQQTYHLNSLGIKGVQIRLCLRKKISDMSQKKSKLLSNVGLSFVEVEDAHIHLSPVEIATPLKQKHVNGISKMYIMQSFVGVASGLNILGNPSQFANEFEAGRNVGGLYPFFRSIVAGTSNSVSKIIGTIGSGVGELTFDREFMKERIDNKNIKAQSFGMGLKIGLKEFAHSVKSGLTGVVEQPIQGHREEGGIGALKGVLAGLTGLITKPLTGLIFAASKTIQGVNSSTTYLDLKKLQRQQLITRPLYHKFKLVRPYKSEDELAYNILLNWWDYCDVELVGGYLLQNEEGDGVIDILIITCSELILIDLESKEVRLKLRTEELLATGKFTQGVVLYFQDGESEEDQDEIVFRLQNDPIARDNLYYTLKGFIGLYAQKH